MGVERVKAYVDGFNLYHGLREKHGRRYHWLDPEALITSLLRRDQSLVGIDYFTARVRQQPDSETRQATYLDALSTHCSQVTIIEGRFQQKRRYCRACGVKMTLYEEKETDVSIAAALIEDAVNDVFDAAMLVSADSDLCPAVRAVGRLRPKKRIFAAFRRDVAATTCATSSVTPSSPSVTPSSGTPYCRTSSRREACCSGGPPTGSRVRRDSPRVCRPSAGGVT
ncbi:MAG: NYN domain-containing protein [Pseudonocardiaceae bacterium]